MARRITEEKLTLTILDWLEINNWSIISFDFPQSGTGIIIHPNNRTIANKNLGGFIPDIIACKAGNMVFFENKNRFVLKDYEKVDFLRNTINYSKTINQIASKFNCQHVFFGIGIPFTKSNQQNDEKNWHLTDFTIMVSDMLTIEKIYDPNSLFHPI